MIDHIIDNLLQGNELQHRHRTYLFAKLLSGGLAANQAMAAIVLLHKRGECSSDLISLVRAARQKRKKMATGSLKKSNLCDACGTGGDRKGTFNVSTVASFVAAGAGARIAKHGNRAITSRCGSSDLMETLGVNIEAAPAQMFRAIKKGGIGYFHAPFYSTAFKNVQSLRKELGSHKIKSIFNMVGPLLNPLSVKRQMIGVYDKRLIPIMLAALKTLGTQRALVLSGIDGTDEITTYQSTKAGRLDQGRIRLKTMMPFDFGLPVSGRSISGGTIRQNRQIALIILKNRDRSSKLNTVLANAAAILYISGLADSLKHGVALAKKSVQTGSAYRSLQTLIRISHDS